MGDERGSIWAKTRTFWRAVFEKPSPKEKTGKQWPPLFSARLPLGAHSAALPASSSVRKLLPAAHGLPKNGLCKLIPEGEWQRVPVGRGAASQRLQPPPAGGIQGPTPTLQDLTS